MWDLSVWGALVVAGFVMVAFVAVAVVLVVRLGEWTDAFMKRTAARPRRPVPLWKRAIGVVLLVALGGALVAVLAFLWTRLGSTRAALDIATGAIVLIGTSKLARRIRRERLRGTRWWVPGLLSLAGGVALASVGLAVFAFAGPIETWPWYVDLTYFGVGLGIFNFLGSLATYMHEIQRHGRVNVPADEPRAASGT